MTNEVETQEQDVQEARAFTTAFELNDLIHDYTTTMEKSHLGTEANRGKLAVLRVQLKKIIVDVVRKHMQPADKTELEKLFASVDKTIAEARTEILKRTDADPVR